MKKNKYKNPILLWVYCVQQQLNFYSIVTKHLPKPLKITMIDNCLQYAIHLLNWAEENMAKDQFEHNIFAVLHEKYKPIQAMLQNNKKQPLSKWVYRDAYRKCELLGNIIKYIEGIMNTNKVTNTTIKLITEIQKEIKANQPTSQNDQDLQYNQTCHN